MRQSNGWRWVPTLYFAEGLPYVAVMTISVIMYKRLGISNTDIALYTAWLYLPWVIKPLWSPFVDIFATKRLWILAMQTAIGIGFGAVALTLPMPAFFTLSLAAFWIVAFLSATHDIAADGFYMLGLDKSGQSFFVGIRTTFYRLAMLTGQGILVVVAGVLEERMANVASAWSAVFVILSVFFVLTAFYHSRALPRPPSDVDSRTRSAGQVWREFGGVFSSFFRKPHIGVAIAFMLLYRFPEAQLVKLISPFLLDGGDVGGLGMTTAQVGIAYGTVGLIGLLSGGIIGGIVASRGGLGRWFMPMAWSMSLTCLTFLYLSCFPGQSLFVINLCVFVEQFGYGFGGTAYTLYLIYFSDGPRSTSHYAICTGFMALGMMLPGMAAGWIQEQIGYPSFFLWTMICCLATIISASAAKNKLP